MCPACIESTALIVAGAGGILTVCIGKCRAVFRTIGLRVFQKRKEMMGISSSAVQ